MCHPRRCNLTSGSAPMGAVVVSCFCIRCSLCTPRLPVPHLPSAVRQRCFALMEHMLRGCLVMPRLSFKICAGMENDFVQ
jgi:hypothetical protein